MSELVYDSFKMKGYKEQKIAVPHKDTHYYHRNRRVYIGIDFNEYEEYFLEFNSQLILLVSNEIFLYYLKKDGKLTSYWNDILEIERKRIHKNIDNKYNISTQDRPSYEYQEKELILYRKHSDLFWKLYTWEYSYELKYRKHKNYAKRKIT